MRTRGESREFAGGFKHIQLLETDIMPATMGLSAGQDGKRLLWGNRPDHAIANFASIGGSIMGVW